VRCSSSCVHFFGEQLASVTLNLEGIHVVSITSHLFDHVFHLFHLQCMFTGKAYVVNADILLHCLCCILTCYLYRAYTGKACESFLYGPMSKVAII